jgi:hypothetical protein
MPGAFDVKIPMTDSHLRGSADTARRDFLKTCMGLAAAAGLSGCGPLASRTRFTRLLLADPSPDDYRPILTALMGTVLPFGDPRFPLTPLDMLARFESLFSMEDEERLIPLQRGLILFNETELFSHAFGPVREEERKTLAAYPGNTPEVVEQQLERKRVLDGKLLAGFLKKQGMKPVPFVDMNPAERREYLWIWSQSAFVLKRQFYRTAKAVILIAAYSAPEAWKPIGYQGPVI